MVLAKSLIVTSVARNVFQAVHWKSTREVIQGSDLSNAHIVTKASGGETTLLFMRGDIQEPIISNVINAAEGFHKQVN